MTPEICPEMKGTLGSTDRALLRGGARKVALQAEFPRETRIFGGEPRENVLVGAGFSSRPRRTRKWEASVQGFTRPVRARCGRRSPGVLGSPPGPSHEPATEGVRVNRIGVAPLLSRAIVRARRRIGPKAAAAPDHEETRLEAPSKEATPPDATPRGQPRGERRGAQLVRGRARGSHSIAEGGRQSAPLA